MMTLSLLSHSRFPEPVQQSVEPDAKPSNQIQGGEQSWFDWVIHHVALRILIEAVLCSRHSTIALVGGCFGVLFEREAKDWAQRIDLIYRTGEESWPRTWFLCLVAAIVEGVARRSRPISTQMAAFYCSAQWGAALYRYAEAHRSAAKAHTSEAL